MDNQDPFLKRLSAALGRICTDTDYEANMKRYSEEYEAAMLKEAEEYKRAGDTVLIMPPPQIEPR